MKHNRTPAWSWRHAILQSDLPPTTRHVLLVISCFMNEVGDGCFRTTREFAEWTGLSERAICTHIQKAVETGWLEKAQHGFRGQKWKTHEYRPLQPEQFYREKGTEPNDNLGEKALNLTTEGTEPNDTKALNEVQQDNTISNYNLNTISNAQEREGGADAPERERAAPEFSEKKASEDKRFWQAFDDYPRFQTSSKKPMYVAWAKLTEERRNQITKARVMAYLDLCRRDGVKHPPAIGVILSEDDLLFNTKIEALLAKDDVPNDDGSQPLNKFGKAWGVVRLLWLRAGAKPIGDVPDYRRHRDMFPNVHAMNGSAITRLSPQNAVKQETLDACQRVEQGSAEWQAWLDYHAAMDWPMVDVGDWDKPVWFPARVPSEWAGYQEVAA